MSSIITAEQSLQVIDRPSLIIKDTTLFSSGVVIKGVPTDSENNSQFELLLSRVNSFREVKKFVGNPNITSDGDIISAIGEINFTRSVAFRKVFSLFQRDAYIADLPVNERYQVVRANRTLNSRLFDIDRSVEIKNNFTELNNDNNTRRKDLDVGISVFLNKFGYVHAMRVNDSDGNIIGRVFGFKLTLVFTFFVTSTEQFIGSHVTIDKGFGNMLPDFVNDYLSKQKLDNNIREKIRNNDTRPGELRRINWISLGHNNTYDLDLYRGMYSFERRSVTLALPSLFSTISTNAINFDIEKVMSDYISSEEMNGFDDENVDTIESEVINAALTDESVNIENVFGTTSSVISDEFNSIASETEKSPLNLIHFLVGFIVILPVMRVKKIKR